MKKYSKGFTIAELLIIVGIISVLVAIAILILPRQLERSKETVDLANARSAYSELIVTALIDDQSSLLYAGNGLYEITFPLKQGQDNWALPENNLIVAGITATNTSWIGVPLAHGTCKISYTINDSKLTIDWGGKGNLNYLHAIASFINKTLMNLKQIDNDKRVAADQSTLKALAEAILGQNWTLQELKDKLGILVQGNTVRIADYYQDKNGSYDDGAQYDSDGFRIVSKSDFITLLTDIGFNGGNKTTSGNTTIYDKSLFYSDELATNKFKNYPIDQTKRSIIIESIKTDANGKIIGFTIYTKAMDNQANMNDKEKAKFKITLP